MSECFLSGVLLFSVVGLIFVSLSIVGVRLRFEVNVVLRLWCLMSCGCMKVVGVCMLFL